jgi:hypothetical protein
MVSVASFDARYLKQLPVGQLVKDTLEMLQGDRRVFTRVELEAALMARGYMRHQMPLDELWQLLARSGRVTADDAGYKYRPRHHAATPEDIVALVDRHPNGLPAAELADAYDGALADAARLVAATLVMGVECQDGRKNKEGALVLYPAPAEGFAPSDAVRELWAHPDVSTSLPTQQVEIELALREAGRVLIPHATAKIVMARRERVRRRGAGRRRKVREPHPTPTVPYRSCCVSRGRARAPRLSAELRSALLTVT